MLGLRQKLSLGFCGLLPNWGESIDVILRENYRAGFFVDPTDGGGI